MEIASPERRALVVSWQPTSQGIAATTGALVGVILSKTMTPDALEAYGWRIAFLIGAACLPFGLWMRRGLPETIPQSELRPWSRAPAILSPGAAPTSASSGLR